MGGSAAEWDIHVYLTWRSPGTDACCVNTPANGPQAPLVLATSEEARRAAEQECATWILEQGGAGWDTLLPGEHAAWELVKRVLRCAANF